jgi:glycosyltransferase involved in cell wall biosynthesis
MAVFVRSNTALPFEFLPSGHAWGAALSSISKVHNVTYGKNETEPVSSIGATHELPGVAIVMATHNGERYLRPQLESFSEQTLLPSRLYVFDDASTDNTMKVLEQYARTAPFPVVLEARKERLGFADNFLQGALTTTERFIAFSDQDDVWSVRKLEDCIQALVTQQVSLVLHTSRPIDSNGAKKRGARRPLILRKRTVRQISKSNPRAEVPGYAQVFNREVLEAADPLTRPSSQWFDGQMSHDEYVYFVALELRGVFFLPRVLALHRYHNANTSGKDPLPDSIGSLRKYLSSSLHSDANIYRKRQKQALECSEFLADQGAFRSPAGWLSVAKRDGLRASLYEENFAWRGLRTMVRCIASGVYLPRNRAGAGARGFIKDARQVALATKHRRTATDP